MALFDSSALFHAWSQHQADLSAQRLQRHNDFLYEIVKDSILARREELFNDLLTVTRTAQSPRDLSIRLWSYQTASYDAPKRSLDPAKLRESEELLRRKGYQWFVGAVPKSPDFAVRYDDDGWDESWRWVTPRPVHDVIRNTDFLQRIALLFGPNDYSVTASVYAVKRIYEPLEVRAMKIELRLHYYPRGAHVWMTEQNLAAQEKYADYIPFLNPFLRPFVSTGEAPPLPKTPPPPPPKSDPPPLPQRSNGGGILHYEGANALQRAARDMLTEFNSSAAPALGPAPAGQYVYYKTGPDGQRTCHCYFSDDEE